MAKSKIKYIDAIECSNAAMVIKNESKIRFIIDMVPMVKEWVGIGWITLREADADDLRKYPVVKRKETNDRKTK